MYSFKSLLYKTKSQLLLLIQVFPKSYQANSTPHPTCRPQESFLVSLALIFCLKKAAVAALQVTKKKKERQAM